jgi:hypothetical protein
MNSGQAGEAETRTCPSLFARANCWYPLRNNRLWIAAVVDSRRPAAYAIFNKRDNPRIGLKRVRLVDFQSLDGSTALLAPLLSWAVRNSLPAQAVHAPAIRN